MPTAPVNGGRESQISRQGSPGFQRKPVFVDGVNRLPDGRRSFPARWAMFPEENASSSRRPPVLRLETRVAPRQRPSAGGKILSPDGSGQTAGGKPFPPAASRVFREESRISLQIFGAPEDVCHVPCRKARGAITLAGRARGTALSPRIMRKPRGDTRPPRVAKGLLC